MLAGYSNTSSNLPSIPVARLVGHDGAIQTVSFTGTVRCDHVKQQTQEPARPDLPRRSSLHRPSHTVDQ